MACTVCNSLHMHSVHLFVCVMSNSVDECRRKVLRMYHQVSLTVSATGLSFYLQWLGSSFLLEPVFIFVTSMSEFS